MTARKSSRLPSRSNTKNMSGLLTSRVVNTRPNPTPVSVDLTSRTRQELHLYSTGSSSQSIGFTLSTKQIVDTFAGTSSLWDKVQIHRIDVYGAETGVTGSNTSAYWPSVTVTLNSSGVTGFAASDKPTFYSDAVAFSRRSHVGIVPNTLFRNSWLDTANNETLITIVTDASNATGSSSGTTYGGEVQVQISCILRSSAGTQQPSFGDVVIRNVTDRLRSRAAE